MKEKSLNLARKLAECIYTCNNCFYACLEEEDVKMMKECIRLDKECAVTCATALQTMHEKTCFRQDILEVCEKMCRACAAECEKFPEDHCQECARVCRECADACADYMK